MPLQQQRSKKSSIFQGQGGKLSAALVGLVASSAVYLFFSQSYLSANYNNNISLRGGLMDTSTPHQHDQHTIIDIISATSFPIDSQTGNIKFPPNITTVVLDVGARKSDYLSVLEKGKDPNVAMILIDPLPDSSIPLMKRVAEYSMQDWKGGGMVFGSRQIKSSLPS